MEKDLVEDFRVWPRFGNRKFCESKNEHFVEWNKSS